MIAQLPGRRRAAPLRRDTSGVHVVRGRFHSGS